MWSTLNTGGAMKVLSIDIIVRICYWQDAWTWKQTEPVCMCAMAEEPGHSLLMSPDSGWVDSCSAAVRPCHKAAERRLAGGYCHLTLVQGMTHLCPSVRIHCLRPLAPYGHMISFGLSSACNSPLSRVQWWHTRCLDWPMSCSTNQLHHHHSCSPFLLVKRSRPVRVGKQKEGQQLSKK